MRGTVLSLAVGMLVVSPALAGEAAIFHTEHFSDNTVVSLGLVGSHAARQPGYDYEVKISLSSRREDSGSVYDDTGRHRALVRCSTPARVQVQGVDYSVETSEAGGDWKSDLWRAVCALPVS